MYLASKAVDAVASAYSQAHLEPSSTSPSLAAVASLPPGRQQGLFCVNTVM